MLQKIALRAENAPHADSNPVTRFSAKQFSAAIEAAIFAPKHGY